MSDSDVSRELLRLELQRRIDELTKKKEGIDMAAAFFLVCSAVYIYFIFTGNPILNYTIDFVLLVGSIGLTLAGFYQSKEIKNDIAKVKQKLRKY